MAISFTKNNGVFLHQAQRDQIVVYLKSPSPEKKKQWRFLSPKTMAFSFTRPSAIRSLSASNRLRLRKNKTIAFSFNRPSASGWPSGSGLVAGCSWIPRIANSGKRGIAKHQTWPKWHSRTILNICCTILVEFVDKRLNG